MTATSAALDVLARGDVAAPLPSDPDEPGWERPAPPQDALRWDALGAGALYVGALLSMVLVRVAGMYPDQAAGWVAALMLAAVTLPLAVRRRWPSAVVVVVGAAFITAQALGVVETLVMNIALFCALYTVGAWEADRRRATAARGLVVVAMMVWLFVALFMVATDPETAKDMPDQVGVLSPFVSFTLLQLLTNVLYFGGAWFFGERAWRSARERARTDWRTHLLVVERHRAEEQAVALERLRLARELHDAVAHHVSLMGVQAAAARTVLASDPVRAADALGHVEDAAREAVQELHGILGMLRDGGVTVGATPASGEALASLDLDRLPDLVTQARAGGLAVAYQEVGEPRRLRPLASLNLYRIAQEALTNIRKHAGPGARAEVRLRWSTDDVELEVSDDGGTARPARPATSGGMGLVGMRERAAADGGTFEASRRRSGGFVVRVRLPLAAPVDGGVAVPAPGTKEQG
ncbi:sensor histidine kinase [Cellulomonas wangsupingiae]|uniref:sensor histidine kinase n=1 Tax=Cellulomonas wangsupingiae TaxID=2968085 RepID=UPI001D0F4681|nr:sensor histidine kinase [Cellulomonas wangsupingiae]MCM0640814.1 sensor histidine kinase [Cellulomonas wangsupingiae]